MNVIENERECHLAIQTINKEQQIELSKHWDYYVRSSLARNPALASDIQYMLANDKERSVRWNIAQNTTIDDIQFLLADEFSEIFNQRLDFIGPKTKTYLKMKKVLDK